jgi:transcriptional regulator with XRE-family HTH domain
MTQFELARTLGISRTSVANIEAGQQRVMAHNLADLARALGVPVSRFVEDEPPHAVDAQIRRELEHKLPEAAAADLIRKLRLTVTRETRNERGRGQKSSGSASRRT